MNNRQLAEHIGSIDDQLIQQAGQLPEIAARRRPARMRRLLALAAVLALMVSSFSIGALAFSRQVVEVQQTLSLDGVDLTLLFPDSWDGHYAVEKNGNSFIVYEPQIRAAVSEGLGPYDGGVLFTIACYNEPMTEKQFIKNGLDLTAYRYLLATSGKTYVLHYASDVQYDPGDAEQAALYQSLMAGIPDIRFVVENVFAG